MKIIVKNSQKVLPISAKAVKAIVRSVIEFEGHDCDEVSVHLVTTKKISSLHQQYFDDPSTTDCISFPIEQDSSSPYKLLGDVFVCPETALLYAKKKGLDPLAETTLYIVHGLLHLMGYDDTNGADKRKMRAAEKRHMKNLIARREELCS